MDNLTWRDKLNAFRLPIGLLLVGLVLIIGGVVTSGILKQKPKSFPKESLVQNQKTISVDVSGAVVSSGVYQLKEGSRIEDAVQAAGGFNQNANQEYISKYLNMAQKVSDGSKIYVPSEGEQGSNTSKVGFDSFEVDRKVNINTASQSELEALPGIGPVTASKIISDRPYQQIEELLEKKVVSKAVFEKIKDQLVLY